MDTPEVVTQPANYVVIAENIIASDYALKNLNKSLGEAQNEFTSAIKDETNTYGGYKYTPLTNIIAAVRPALTKHHLTISQFPLPDLERKTISLVTRMSHWDSGEWVQSTLELPAELALGKGGTPVFNQQTIGGSITYAQKYAYKPILGIADSEETIDSTEEKGDLPPRAPKAAPKPVREPAAQVNSGARPNPVENNGTFLLSEDLLQCVVKGVSEKETKQKRPYIVVTFNGRVDGFNYASCFHASLIPLLKSAVDKPITIRLSPKRSDDGKSIQYFNIEDVLWMDGVEYESGKPKVAPAEQEAEQDAIPF